MPVFHYVARVEGREASRQIEVLETPGEPLSVRVDGTEHRIDALPLSHGAVSLIVDGQSYSVELEEEGDFVNVLVRDHLIRVDIADERRLRMRAASSQFTLEGNQTVAAPMPGRVVKILVKVGDAVAEGQPVAVVEAMKMENELKSPKAGTVAEIRAREGDAVEGGAALLVVG
jgi:biotin carboxyl carrier protein